MVVVGLMLSTLLAVGQACAQDSGTPVKNIEALSGALAPEPGIRGVPQLPNVPPVEMSGFGQFEEAPEGTHQAGNAAMRYLRRGAEALRGALGRLEQASVEGDAMGVSAARRDCRLLIETLRENNPADILGDELDTLGGALADPKQGDAGVTLARLQRAAMDFRFLYPSCDLEREVAAIDRLAHDGKTDMALAGTRSLRRAVAAEPAAAPSAALERAFAEAQRLLDAKQADAARRQLRTAQEAAAAVHAAGLLGEAIWYLDRTVDALGQGLLEIARLSADNAGVFLDAAAKESPALREPLAGPRAEAARLALEIAAGTHVSPAEVKVQAERVQLLSSTR